MKIRNGFVSNSSSSSFCVMGTVFSNNIKEIQGKIEKIPELECNFGLGVYWDEDLIVGLPLSAMKENETLGQFKRRALGFVKQVDKTVKEVGWKVDGGYDG